MIPYLVPNTFDLQRLCDSAGKYLFTSDNLALYVQAAAPSVPTNNGVGVLADTISCTVKHELNGQDELVLQYPVTGALFSEIQLRALIVAKVERTRGNQPYRIYRITKPISGVITVYARHLAYDLAGIVVEPFTATTITAALSGLKTHSMTNNPFVFSSSRSTTATFGVNVPTSIWSLMGGQQGSLLDVYGGEYTFDGYDIHLENRVGSNNGASVRYGVNMTDLEQDASCADCYTGVVAYWSGEDGVVYSPVVSAAGTYGYVKILSVDMSDKWEEKPTVAQLSAAAATYITANEIGIPKVSWKIGFVPLDTTEEYKDIAMLERADLGDTVSVKFERLGVDATARVNAIEWNVLLDRYISVELGSVKNNIADTIATQTREITNLPTKAEVKSLAEQISDTLTRAILGADGGTIRFLDTNNDGEEDTLYVADNPDPAQAVKVWRWNYEGWAASENGYNGPFVLGATVGGGLLANFVTAANLVAGTIQSADGETFVLDLDNGTMQIGGNGIITSPDGSFVINLATGVLTTSVTTTYHASDYTSADHDRINAILLGSVTPTAADYAKYDFYEDGVISVTDLVICQAIILSGEDLVLQWKFVIDPSDRNKTVKLIRKKTGAQTAEAAVFSAGLSGITADDGNFSGTVYCNRLFVNGTEITP